MTHLGSLGKRHDPVNISFDYFGETEIRGAEGLSDLHHLDFMEQAAGMSVDDPRGWSLVKDFARVVIAEDDFERFWATARSNGQSQQDVGETLMAVLEASTARPTEQPSGSSDGQQVTVTNSQAVSSSLDDRLSGRPDLQLLVANAREAQAS